MRFAIKWTWPADADAAYCKAHQEVLVEYIKNGCPSDKSDGFEVLERIHFPLKGGIQFVEAINAAKVYKYLDPWFRKWAVNVEVLTALSDEELVSYEESISP